MKVPEYLRRALRRLINAEVEVAWKGGGDPADWPLIDEELVRAKKAYLRALERFAKEQQS